MTFSSAPYGLGLTIHSGTVTPSFSRRWCSTRAVNPHGFVGTPQNRKRNKGTKRKSKRYGKELSELKELIERKLLNKTIRVMVEPIDEEHVRIVDYQRKRDTGERWMRVKNMIGKTVRREQVIKDA